MLQRIHITGASGSGVTTLGRSLAAAQDLRQIDTDHVFWMPSDPPYQEKRPIPERLRILREIFDSTRRWVLSGSVIGWGDPLIPQFELVVYLYTPTEIRLDRLRRRETARFGASVQPGGARHQEYLDFLDWAAAYDSATTEGRDRFKHDRWLTALPCPVLRLDGALPTAELAAAVSEFAAAAGRGIPSGEAIR